MKVLLTIQERTQPEDTFGEFPEIWADLRQEWVQLMPLGGAEYEVAQRLESGTTHKARCPWFQGAHSGLRLTDGSRYFNAQAVINVDERNRQLEWQLQEKAYA
jgi:head-tail adaptor